MSNSSKGLKKLILLNIILILIALIYVIVDNRNTDIKETGTYQVEDISKESEFNRRIKQGYKIVLHKNIENESYVEYKDILNIEYIIQDYDMTIDNNKTLIILNKIKESNKIPIVVPLEH